MSKSVNHTSSKIIPYAKQFVTAQDVNEVIQVLTSDYLTQGPAVSAFEVAFADYVGARFAVAVNNGTAALHLACIISGVRSGKRVITTPISFAASGNCVLYCGGSVEFVDIDPETYCMDSKLLRKKLDSATKGAYCGVIPVDFAGHPAPVEEIRQLADAYGLWVIEDACHAPGARYQDSEGVWRKVGANSHSDLTVFSFHPVKHIAAGEGGIVTTNSRETYEHLLSLRSHGIERSPERMESNHGGWYYEMQHLGFNYRLSDIHAALAHSQLRRANDGFERRAEIAKRYNDELRDLPVQLPTVESNSLHAFHLYIIQTPNRDALYGYLKQNGIHPQVHYVPIHMHPYYYKMVDVRGNFPEAENFYRRALSLPMYPSMTHDEQTYVVAKLREFFERS